MLVVGHRMQAIERMGDVHEPALALDLGDRLLERHPAGDLLLDEQADHLALVCGLDLLGDDHLDPVGLLARLERARNLVVVGDRDRAEAPCASLGQQYLDRRGAVVGVVGVHVQIDVDQRPCGELASQPRAGAVVVTARDEPVRRALELVGDPRP